MKVFVEETIAASHKVPTHSGMCKRLHGHNWKVQVWADGPVQPDGFVLDFSLVRDYLRRFDHQDLNSSFALPTAELLAGEWLRGIYGIQPSLLSLKVRVWESDHQYAEAHWSQAGPGDSPVLAHKEGRLGTEGLPAQRRL